MILKIKRQCRDLDKTTLYTTENHENILQNQFKLNKEMLISAMKHSSGRTMHTPQDKTFTDFLNYVSDHELDSIDISCFLNNVVLTKLSKELADSFNTALNSLKLNSTMQLTKC